MGGFCLEHEAPITRVFVRGRPFAPDVTAHVAHTAPIARTIAAQATYRFGARKSAAPTTTSTG